MPYTADQFKNSAASRIIGGASGGGFSLQPTDTVFTIVGGTGAGFSSATPFMLAAGNLAGAYELMQCTSRVGDVFTVVRGQEGTLPQTWPVNTPITQVITAGSLNDLWTAVNSGRVVNVKDYGARGDGVTDDTAAIQSAIAAVQNQTTGGQVFFPSSTYNVSAPLLVTADNVMLLGESWATRLQAVGSSWVSGSYLVQMVPAPSGLRSGVRVSNLYLDGGNIAGLRGIQFGTPTRSMLDRTRLSNFAGGYTVHWGETSSGYGFGTFNIMLGCYLSNSFGNASVGVRTDNTDRLTITDCEIVGFQNNSNGYGIQCTNWNSQFVNNQITTVDVGIDISFASHIQIANNQFDNININAIRLRGSHECVVANNYIGTCTTTNQAALSVSNPNTYSNVVSGNTVQSGSGWQYFVQEIAGISGGASLYQNNQPGGITSLYLTGRNANGSFNVREFGAVGDGVINDTAAIQAALDAARTAGGGAVSLPSGTYLVSPVNSVTNSSVWACLYIGSNGSLIGDGTGSTTIKLAANSRNQCWIVANYTLNSNADSNITVANLTIDGNSPNQTAVDAQYGLYLSGVRGISVNRVKMTRVYGTNAGGLGPNGTNGEGFFCNLNNCADATLVDCVCMGDSVAPSSSGFAANYCTNVRYIGCTSYGLKSGMGFTNWHCSHILHTGCHAYYCGVDGFHNEFVVHATYSACVSGGITDDYTPGPIGPINTSLGNGNSGFHFFTPQRVQVSACLSRGNTNYGLWVEKATNSFIEIDGGAYTNNVYGIRLQDATTVATTYIYGRPDFSGNSSSFIWYNGAVTSLDALAAPAIPASGTPLPNPFPFATTFWLSGGQVSQVAVRGQGGSVVNTNLTSGMFRLSPQGQVTLTYTTAPTWVWTGF